MNIFDFRDRLVGDYADYVKSFIAIREERIRNQVDQDLAGGFLWHEPSIGLNPSFAKGAWIDELVDRSRTRPHQRRGTPVAATLHPRVVVDEAHQTAREPERAQGAQSGEASPVMRPERCLDRCSVSPPPF